ncbi:L-histidine N(alpha)-methyltransferase [Agarilytica rhodophyticola]|uniref:L-histidine N(alpha)-methyltransferase n=1 Tax=Agarilytica rhodophyticola TaxID=1737490 RepID=UPI000B349927|nr:L-histidine N(alpha)-methyltransferase [Agarilytica rhodophyticola]
MPEAALRKAEYSVERDEFYKDVIDGLTKKTKTLHPKYFYDKKGSEYFDQICDLDEYYPYKTELALLPKIAADVAKLLEGEYALIEFGAGSLLKVKPLLQAVEGIKKFIPIDISGDHLRESCLDLSKEFSKLVVSPIEGDFCQPIEIGDVGGLEKIGFFPGSTIGNFKPDEAKAFLANARTTLGKNSYMIIGVDTKKSPEKLHRAYNDKDGVTAKFNLNILDRISSHFDSVVAKEKFEHYAYYNMYKGCIEMHLVCLEPHILYLDDTAVEFEKGESIHTESSFKYSPKEFTALAQSVGWQVEKLWLAQDDMFSTFLLKSNA